MRQTIRKSWKGLKELLCWCPYYWNSVVRGTAIDAPPIFIVGCGHSGTSLLLAILGSHSRIYAVPYETYFATQQDSHLFRKTMKRFEKWAVSMGKCRWVEKSPAHILHLESILGECPEAKVLLIIRDGRDVACSIKARTGSLTEGIERWVEHNEAARKYWEHPNVLMLKYEDLVQDFEAVVNRVLEFLEEPYEQGIRDYHLSPKKWYSKDLTKPQTAFGKNHRQYRNWQINQPLFDGSGKWKELSEEELKLIDEKAGPLLMELEYC